MFAAGRIEALAGALAIRLQPFVLANRYGLGEDPSARGAITGSMQACRSEAAGGRNAAAFDSADNNGLDDLGAAALAAPAAYGEAGERPRRSRRTDRGASAAANYMRFVTGIMKNVPIYFR